MCTASATKLQEHVDSKHSKNGFEVMLLACLSFTFTFAYPEDAQLLTRSQMHLASPCKYTLNWTMAEAVYVAGMLSQGSDCLRFF